MASNRSKFSFWRVRPFHSQFQVIDSRFHAKLFQCLCQGFLLGITMSFQLYWIRYQFLTMKLVYLWWKNGHWITDPPCCLRLFLGALQQCVDVGRSIRVVIQSWLSHTRFSIARCFYAWPPYRPSWYFCAQYSNGRPGTLCLYRLQKKSDFWQFIINTTNPGAPCNGAPAGLWKRRIEWPSDIWALAVLILRTCQV